MIKKLKWSLVGMGLLTLTILLVGSIWPQRSEGGIHLADGTNVSIRIEKSARKLKLLQDDEVFKVFPIVLGFAPKGDKQMQGDGKTPEGHFTVRDKYPHAKWHKFIWVDYPTSESRRRFQERKRLGVIPADANIGGEIGIHGVPGGLDVLIDLRNDWTLGCIAMKNKDLDVVYANVQAGTEIEVLP